MQRSTACDSACSQVCVSAAYVLLTSVVVVAGSFFLLFAVRYVMTANQTTLFFSQDPVYMRTLEGPTLLEALKACGMTSPCFLRADLRTSVGTLVYGVRRWYGYAGRVVYRFVTGRLCCHVIVLSSSEDFTPARMRGWKERRQIGRNGLASLQQ